MRSLKQLVQGPGIAQKLINDYPNFILDLSDVILANLENPLILNEIQGLLHTVRAVVRLPESLEVLLRDYEPEPHIEIVHHFRTKRRQSR